MHATCIGCAQAVVEQHAGRFPDRSDVLATLPGIGRSTAAAIAAFCFGERVAILDGNVKRVLTRVLGFDGDLAEAAHERRLWALATELLPQADNEAYTQGLMDLGATVCLARSPQCLICPIHTHCVAERAGEPQRYPVKTRKLKRGRREHVWLWLRWRDRLWLIQRPQQGVWAGLWSLPEFDSPEAFDAASAHWPGTVEPLPSFTHTLTHLDWDAASVPLDFARLDDTGQARCPHPGMARRPLGRPGRSIGDGTAGPRCASCCSPRSERVKAAGPRLLDHALAAQEFVHQLEPHRRIRQLHQLLLGGQRDRQDFAPAVGHPTRAGEMIGRQKGLCALGLERCNGVRQAANGVELIGRRRHRLVVGQGVVVWASHRPSACWRVLPMANRRVPRQRTCRMPGCVLSTSINSAITPVASRATLSSVRRTSWPERNATTPKGRRSRRHTPIRSR